MSDLELIWLAGLLEGEGCFTTKGQVRRYKGIIYQYKTPAIQLNMTDEDVVARVASLWHVQYRKQRNGTRRSSFQIRVTGERARTLMRQLCPMMGLRRGARISGILETCKSRREEKIARAMVRLKLQEL